MKIISLELKGYKFLKLNNIDYIKITPESKIQLILGTNGSGKSSILKELSPLPAEHKEFEKTGYKYIKILYNSSLYVLKSIFNSGDNEYHFIKDDEELNIGHTVSVFKELVKKHFGITTEIHELMIGRTKFHSMSVAERRNWFTKLSDNDCTFALKYYGKLKELHRDTQGAIKLNQSRLVQESDKLLTEEQEVSEREYLQELNDLLAVVLDNKKPIKVDKHILISKIKEQDVSLTNISNNILNLRTKFNNDHNFKSLQDIDDYLLQLRVEISSNDRTIANISKSIEDNNKSIEMLRKNDIESFAEIDSHINSLCDQINELTKQLHTGIKFTNVSDSLRALSSLQNNLIDILNNLEKNENRMFSRDNYEVVLNKLDKLQKDIKDREQYLDTLFRKRKELEHLKNSKQTECPDCGFTWTQGYDVAVYNKAISDIDSTALITEKLKSDQLVNQSLLVRFNQYFEGLNRYRSITSNWTVLQPLWEYILEKDIIAESPKSIIGIIESSIIDLQLLCKIESLNNTLKENYAIKELAHKNQAVSMKNIEDNLQALNKSLYEVMETRRRNIYELDKINGYKALIYNMEILTSKLNEHLDERVTLFEELKDVIKSSAQGEAINTLRLEIAKREQVLSKIDIQKALVKDIENQLLDLEERKDLYGILVKEMSPNEGLIAKSLTGFINRFLFQVNSFIKKIWLYPLEILSVDIEGDDLDLDYKFMVKVNDSTTASDIKFLSSGQKEIIDLAFRIVSMQYLKLSNAPIYLDEFAASMDEAHRASAHYVITNLLTSANFSQIYMISHYNNSYGSMKNSDILVLHPSNISLPKDAVFNKHVVIN